MFKYASFIEVIFGAVFYHKPLKQKFKFSEK